MVKQTGVIKNYQPQTKKRESKTIQFLKSPKMTIAFHSFIPPDMEADFGRLSLMPCHFPSSSFLSQSFHMPNPLLQLQLGPCLNKNQTASNGIPIQLQRLDDPMGNYGSRGSSSRGGGRWSKHCTTRCCMALTEPT